MRKIDAVGRSRRLTCRKSSPMFAPKARASDQCRVLFPRELLDRTHAQGRFWGKLRNAVYDGQSKDTGKHERSDRLRSLLLRLMRSLAPTGIDLHSRPTFASNALPPNS